MSVQFENISCTKPKIMIFVSRVTGLQLNGME